MIYFSFITYLKEQLTFVTQLNKHSTAAMLKACPDAFYRGGGLKNWLSYLSL